MIKASLDDPEVGYQGTEYNYLGEIKAKKQP